MAIWSMYKTNESKKDFGAQAPDRCNIETLLSTYPSAVSTKNQAMFETTLLSKNIPLSYVPSSSTAVAEHGARGYEGFRKAVFDGQLVPQSFKDVHNHQDGNLANVTLVFVNVHAKDSSWGRRRMEDHE